MFFINFISLIIFYKIHHIIDDMYLYKSYTFFELNQSKSTYINSKKFITTVTAAVTEIYKAFKCPLPIVTDLFFWQNFCSCNENGILGKMPPADSRFFYPEPAGIRPVPGVRPPAVQTVINMIPRRNCRPFPFGQAGRPSGWPASLCTKENRPFRQQPAGSAGNLRYPRAGLKKRQPEKERTAGSGPAFRAWSSRSPGQPPHCWALGQEF
jgi:hypothetical protein